MERVAWVTLPFLVVTAVVLIALTFLPDLVMWLPRLYAN
jgi:TRAP-type C4-dicarboxylate transport system permease large subunit